MIPRKWKLYSVIMLVALTLGAISGGLLTIVGGNQANGQASVAPSSDFSDAAFLVSADGTYAGGLLAPADGSQVVYISANGDTMAGIAARFGVSAAALASANGMSVNEKLSGGEQMIIPTATQPAAHVASNQPAALPAPPAAKVTTPAQQPAANKPAESSAAPQVTAPAVDAQGAYTIQDGDTLSGIAAHFGVSIADLANANGIVSLSQIYSGAKLTIPGKARQTDKVGSPITAPPAQAPAHKAAPVTPSQPAASSQYTVLAGDNLSTIAANYGVSVDTLVNANNLSDANTIYVGQNLTIPGSNQPVSKPQPVAQVVATSRPQPVSQPAGIVGTSGGNIPAAPPASPFYDQPTSSGAGDRWIDVNISTETLTAYEGDVAVFRTAISTGVASYPTVIGHYAIYVKLISTPMSGPGYYLPGVPYTMYFYQGYGIHGTYWHHNFGHPMSHGCVNLPTPAAKWMFDWASVGTPVVTHF